MSINEKTATSGGSWFPFRAHLPFMDQTTVAFARLADLNYQTTPDVAIIYNLYLRHETLLMVEQ